jgi:hypothetical protein
MDKIQQDIIEHPLLSQINIWEQNSIKKIQNAAQIARNNLQEIFDNHKNEMKLLTDDLQLNNCTEIQLNKWTEQLKELRKILHKSLNISFIDDDKEVIHLIKIEHHLEIAEPSMHTSNDLLLTPQEKFSKVIGASSLSEDGLVSTHSGFIFGCSNISGTNLYSSGINQIHFRLEKTSSTCPFFGIYSSSQEMTTHILSSPSVYGWWEFDQTIINGQKHGCQTNKIFQSGDEITLTLDCTNKHIFLQHHRTNKIVQHSIDIQLCPLPWKILVRLYGAVSRIRILQ